MLFHYPIESTEGNWLHEAVTALLRTGMDRIDNDLPVLAWPDCIPLDYRARLTTRTGVRDRLAQFFEAFQALNQPSRDAVRGALMTMNSFPDVFDGASPCARLEELHHSILKPTRELFDFAFDLLKDLGVRDLHYSLIWEKLGVDKVCPFCGLEALRHPKQPRQDLDHYLPISKYPFAGVNLRNLSPMGRDCNTVFKGATDVLINADTGLRRMCSDPYAGPVVEISLIDSLVFGNDDSLLLKPSWSVAFLTDSEECAETWDSVFKITGRYVDRLDYQYRGWLDHFGRWCAHPNSGIQLDDNDSLKDAISVYLDAVLQEGLADSNFLRKAVFNMLLSKLQADANAERIAEWLRQLVASFGQAALE